jgi:hypothetical protein
MVMFLSIQIEMWVQLSCWFVEKNELVKIVLPGTSATTTVYSTHITLHIDGDSHKNDDYFSIT